MHSKESLARKTIYWFKVISLGLLLGFGIQFAQAWTNPTLPAPDGNIAGPLTTGAGSQLKTSGDISLAGGGNLYVGGTVAAMNGFFAGPVQVGGSLSVTGNVGIGTTTPSDPVHIFSTNSVRSTDQVLIEGTGNEGGYLRLQGNWPLLRFGSSAAPSGSRNFQFQNDSTGNLVLGSNNDDWSWKKHIMTVNTNGGISINGKANSLSTVSTDVAGTLVTKDYVDSKVGGSSGIDVATGVPYFCSIAVPAGGTTGFTGDPIRVVTNNFSVMVKKVGTSYFASITGAYAGGITQAIPVQSGWVRMSYVDYIWTASVGMRPGYRLYDATGLIVTVFNTDPVFVVQNSGSDVTAACLGKVIQQ